MKRLVNFCWSIFKWALALAVVAALLAGGYLYFRLDEEIRRYAEASLAEHYPGLGVSVGGARFVPGRGVTVFDIAISPAPVQPGASAPNRLLHIDELLLAGKFETRQLIEGQPVVDRIVVRRAKLNATRNAQGKWNTEALAALPESGGRSAAVEIVDATLIVTDQTHPALRPLVLRNVDLTIERDTEQGAPPGQFRFEGLAEESIAERIQVAGRFAPALGAFSLSLSAEGLRVDQQMLAAIPDFPREKLRGLEVDAVASARLTASAAGRDAEPEISGSFTVVSGVVSHPALPRQVRNLKLAGTFNRRGLSIRNLTAKCGVAEITAACNRHGWSMSAPMAIRGRVTKAPLDEELRKSLPKSLQKQWRRFRPTGEVDAVGTISFDGARLRVDGSADCRNLSVEDSERFPYRMNNGRGVVRFTDEGKPGTGVLSINLNGSAEGRPVAISAEFRELPCPGEPPRPSGLGPQPPCPVGWVDVSAPHLRVSEAMIAALAPHPQASKIARSLSPSGDFGLHWRMQRQNQQQLKPTIDVEIEAKDCAVNYDRFAYPLDHIRGRLVGHNNSWTFDGLEARDPNGPQVVRASGSLRPVDGRPRFEMKLDAFAAELDDALRKALPAEQQQVWAKLHPKGRVNFTVDVGYTLGDQRPQIEIELTPHQRSVSIEPEFFHYRLDRLDGRFILSDGRLRFTGGRAEHGRTMLAADGAWSRGSGGSWQLLLEKLNVDYLDADHDLRLAAPLGLRRVIDELQPVGNFSVHNGRMAFTFDPRKPHPLRTDWDIQLDCHQTDVNFGVRVEGVSGGVRIAGVADGTGCHAYGELNLDTLFWNGVQLTNVRGPLWSDSHECRLGRGVAAKQRGAPPLDITAEAYGGAISLNTRVLHEDRPTYNMAIGLQNIDLQRLSQDYLKSTTPLTGRANGRVTLAGFGTSIHGLEGAGAISVTDANLYQLPMGVALLKVLRNRAPDSTAFDGCNAEFVIQGEHLNFNRLDLLGDAVSLYGRGEVSLDKDVNLIFHTIVGRDGPALPLVRSLVGQASEQILRLRVQGAIDKPDIRREALPLVGNVLEQLKLDLQPRPLSQPRDVPRAAARRRQVK